MAAGALARLPARNQRPYRGMLQGDRQRQAGWVFSEGTGGGVSTGITGTTLYHALKNSGVFVSFDRSE